MNFKVVETSSEERMMEAKKLFEQIQPLLDKGYIYSRAIRKIKNIKTYDSTITGRAWYKDVIEYGESQGYSKKEYTGKRYGGRRKQAIRLKENKL